MRENENVSRNDLVAQHNEIVSELFLFIECQFWALGLSTVRRKGAFHNGGKFYFSLFLSVIGSSTNRPKNPLWNLIPLILYLHPQMCQIHFVHHLEHTHKHTHTQTHTNTETQTRISIKKNYIDTQKSILIYKNLHIGQALFSSPR